MKVMFFIFSAVLSILSMPTFAVEPICDQPWSKSDVAELLIDRCFDVKTFSDENIQALVEDISLDNDVDGPGYVNLLVYFKNDLIGSQVLFSVSTPGCWAEKTQELSCPTDLD